MSDEQRLEEAIQLLAAGKIVGWFHGAAEFGPRALGNRSLLASPWAPYVKENLNEYVKHREAFRPFAISVMAERAADYFEYAPSARFMATLGKAKPEAAAFARWISPSRRARAFARGRARRESASLAVARTLRPDCFRAHAGEYVVQPVRRAAGGFAARCGAQLFLFGRRRADHREFLADEDLRKCHRGETLARTDWGFRRIRGMGENRLRSVMHVGTGDASQEGELGVKLAVIGCGYVGLVSGSCLAEAGHDVVATDNDAARIATLQAGKIPIYEPNLDKVLDSVVREGRLRFTADSAEAVRDADVVFICVGTPPTETGEADLSAIDNVARLIAKESRTPKLVIEKSTVPAQTGEQLKRALKVYATQRGSEVSRGVESGISARRHGGGGFFPSRPDRDWRGGSGERATVARVVSPDPGRAVSAARCTSRIVRRRRRRILW